MPLYLFYYQNTFLNKVSIIALYLLIHVIIALLCEPFSLSQKCGVTGLSRSRHFSVLRLLIFFYKSERKKK